MRLVMLSLAKVQVLFISLMFSAQEQRPDSLAALKILTLLAAATVTMLASDVKVVISKPTETVEAQSSYYAEYTLEKTYIYPDYF